MLYYIVLSYRIILFSCRIVLHSMILLFFILSITFYYSLFRFIRYVCDVQKPRWLYIYVYIYIYIQTLRHIYIWVVYAFTIHTWHIAKPCSSPYSELQLATIPTVTPKIGPLSGDSIRWCDSCPSCGKWTRRNKARLTLNAGTLNFYPSYYHSK